MTKNRPRAPDYLLEVLRAATIKIVVDILLLRVDTAITASLAQDSRA